MDNQDQTETTDNPIAESSQPSAQTRTDGDSELISTNGKGESDGNDCVANLDTDTVAQQSSDPVPHSLEAAAVINSDSTPVLDSTGYLDELNVKSLDAALDNLNDQVTSLLDEASATAKSDSPDAPLDEALATLNSEVLGLLKESRKIQDELKKVNDAKESDSKPASRCGSSQGFHKNQYFDYSLYREASASPPPHPLNTYRWEDIRRDKEKGGYPWTYLHPQELAELSRKARNNEKQFKLAEQAEPAPAYSIQIVEPTELPSSLFPDANPPTDLLSLDFDNIDTQRAIDSYSIKSSVKNSSSGILEVLQDLEAEDERENERKHIKASTTTQSHQDLTDFKPKEESKRFALRSLLKRTHSAPKKIHVTKKCADELDEREKSPPQVKCCHPIVEKLKTMADKQLHKKSPSKKQKVKTVPLPDQKKIVLAEETRIIRLKDSPKAERKNVAAYLEKRDSDDVVEIVQLDESPSETRKRRDESRKLEELEEEQEKEEEQMATANDKWKGFVVPPNVTGSDSEPTVEELLEEEFKNDPPKKAPRKTKEHIYEEIDTPGAITSLAAQKLGKPANLFANAVLHSVLNKEEFKDSLQRQNEIEDAAELMVKEIEAQIQLKAEKQLDKGIAKQEPAEEAIVVKLEKGDDKPVPIEIIDLKPVEEQTKEPQTVEERTAEETHNEDSINKDYEPIIVQDSTNEAKTDIEITIDSPDVTEVEKLEDADEVPKLKNDPRKHMLTKEEKKVKFSQSTEDYQEKLAAEKGPDKEDVELPDHLKISKRWSNMSDHEYEPIGEPIETSPDAMKLVVNIVEPEESKAEVIHVHEETISIGGITGTESPIRSITPFTDISRTEELHTSQIDDSVIEEVPLRREDRKKKSFMENAGEQTKNLQNKISSQASNLRTKFKRSLKSSSASSKGSGSNLKSSLKSSPKSSQPSPKERKKRIDFANKLKSIHMPRMSKPELPKFKIPDKFKLSKSDGDAEEPTSSAVPTEAGTPTVVSVTTEEIFETKTTPRKRFEFGSYPKIFNRFKSQSKPDDHDATDYVGEEDTATQPSSSSFSTHFATVPRTATKIKNSIMSKWNKNNITRSTDREDSESIPHGSTVHDDMREDSVERRIRLASKISMEDEEEPLGILQTKEQIQLASYDEENRAIHEISRAREKEFKARKPLVHQDSDLVSEESNRDIDWEECERMRNKIMGTKTYGYGEHTKRDSHGRRQRNDSNFSTEETQSSGSSGDRRRTGVIEDIDDDEFFLRQRGVSQDNAEISEYISSAIREGLTDNDPHRQFASYSYDNNADFADESESYSNFGERPRKPMRRRAGGFNRSFESYDDYHHDQFTDEIPVATQYFPRHDDENLSFYDNEFNDDLEHANILSREEHFDSDIDNEEFHTGAAKPIVPKRRKGRAPPKPSSTETNQEVLIYRSEPSFPVPIDEPVEEHVITKPVRKNRSISSKSDLAPENQETVEEVTTTIEKSSPGNSRYTINIKESNGYATVKKEPPARPPPPRRRKRSTKSVGEASESANIPKPFKDSPFPERQKRSFNASPARPPRRGSNSSLIDHHKPPSIAPSDGTQYEEIDDELNDDDNEFFPHTMRDRPLPAPPRPPRDKRRYRKHDVDKKFDDNDDAEMVAGSFDDSELSTREFVGAEMATQTSLDIDDLYLPDDLEHVPEYTRTVEDVLRSSEGHPSNTTSDDNLSKGIQKFRESNQRSYSERSRASTERGGSRPITPSALLIEQRIARSPIQTDAALIMHPVDGIPKIDYRTDSAESEYVPYVDEIDDTQIDTEDERIINAAIRRYQMLDEQNSTSVDEPPKPIAEEPTKSTDEADVVEKATIEPPLPPPRRKSSANASQINETIAVPLAEPETLSIASTQELYRFSPEPVNDLSTEATEPYAHVDTLTVVNIKSIEQKESKPNLQITPEAMQEIIERVRETLPTPQPPARQRIEIQTHEETITVETEAKTNEDKETKETAEKEKPQSKDTEEPPKRPPTPTDYTLTSEVPASFYQLRTGISDDESHPAAPPSAIPKHRPRKHNRRAESSSDEECSRRHHHHSHHGARSAGDSSITDLSGQLIRACGRALSSSLNTAGHSVVDFLRSLTKNQDDQQKDLSLVLVILIIIVASLMMLGINGDRSVHHHHWDYFNPPDNLGRR